MSSYIKTTFYVGGSWRDSFEVFGKIVNISTDEYGLNSSGGISWHVKFMRPIDGDEYMWLKDHQFERISEEEYIAGLIIES